MIKFGREVHEDIFDPKAMYKKAILFDEADIGKLIVRGNETLRHFLAKAILLFHLKKMKHKVACEVEISGIGVMDVFDLTTNVDYEVETERYLKKTMRNKDKYYQAGVDLVVIQIYSWNDDMVWLSDFIKHWIRPD